MAPRMTVRPFKSVMRTPALIGARPKRRTAAEASRAARRGRNSTPRVRPRSAASCKRRISRAFGRRAHARTASQAPEPSACSRAHNGRAPLTTATRSRAMPSAASAGAKGIRGGATHTHHRAHRARVRAASAGNSRYSSPLPKRGTRISIRPARGQPLPGRHASSAANPLANPCACAALAQGLASGFAALDACLPGKGWPRAGLIEILVPRFGSGELYLLLPALAALTRARCARWCVWVAPPLMPFAPALAAEGIALDRVAVVSGARPLWALEQALGSGACDAVLAWARRPKAREIRRLQLAAERGRTLGVLRS